MPIWLLHSFKLQERPAHPKPETPSKLGRYCLPSLSSCQKNALFLHAGKPRGRPIFWQNAYRASPRYWSDEAAVLAVRSNRPADEPSAGPPSSSVRHTEPPPVAPPVRAQWQPTASFQLTGPKAKGSPSLQRQPSQ